MRLVRSTLAGLWCLTAVSLAAQTRLVQRTQARATPGGAVIGTVNSGARIAGSEVKGNDARVVIEGWVDASRLGDKRDSFPASVGGKIPLHVRASASLKGTIIAELRPGVGLTTIGEEGTWTHVRRSLWISAAALPNDAAASAKAVSAPKKSAPPQAKSAAPAPKPVTAMPEKTPAAAPETQPAPVPSGWMSAPHGTKVFVAPGGKQNGDLAPGAIVEPLARDRGWVKVRVEGWVNEKDLNPADSDFGSTLTAADLRANPDAAKGKIVRWEVQILSLQTADPLRRDLAKDEPYLLARGPGSENAVLYLTVPPSLLAEAKTIPPLTTMIITAKVRTGRSDPAGTPILDLRSIIKR
jgi:hypothetical protein